MTITDRPPTERDTTQSVTRRDVPMPQIVGGGVLVLIGLMWLLERTGAIDISVTAVLGLATLVIGVSLMLLARDGSHAGLVVLGTIVALFALLTAMAPFEGFQGGVGERVIEVISVDDIRPDYNLALGELTLDLRAIDDIAPGSTLTASVGMGELTVRVPPGIELSVDARAGAGELDIMGETTGGIGLDERFETPGFDSNSPGLTLDLQAFTGRVEVTDD